MSSFAAFLLLAATATTSAQKPQIRYELTHDPREWMEAHGLAEFYGRWYAPPSSLPEIGPALAEMGYQASEEDASLTYLGIRVGDGDASRDVVAVDPEGPAASAGVAIGDRILGCTPRRPNPPRIRDSVETAYRFGLSTVASGADVASATSATCRHELESRRAQDLRGARAGRCPAPRKKSHGIAVLSAISSQLERILNEIGSAEERRSIIEIPTTRVSRRWRCDLKFFSSGSAAW